MNARQTLVMAVSLIGLSVLLLGVAAIALLPEARRPPQPELDAGRAKAEEQWAGVFGARDWHVDEGTDPADLRHFYRVTSPFYPDLERWYDEAAAEWVAETERCRAEQRARAGGT